MNAADAANARTRAIPKGVVQRAIEGVRYAITGVSPENWFGPMQPLKPTAPAEVAGRRFDYPTGYNLQYSPRSYEPVGFADLRALADNCDILRLVIETRKDQIEAQDWDIRPRKMPDGTRPRAGDFANDIAATKDFFAFPDREHDFSQWTRQIAEEMFVIDATSLYKRLDRKGRVCAFEIIDGTTIAPRIDQWGRTPAPPDVAYQQILHGIPAADFAREGFGHLTADELIYYPRNKRPGHVYGHSPVEQIILTANIVTRRSLHQLAFYTDGNLTDAIFTAPSGWTTDQIGTWQNYWNALFSGNLRERRHGIWVPDGTKYTPLKDIVLKDAFDEYLARIVCFCFSVSPQPFVAQVNRATAETAKAQAAEEGLGPVLNWFKRLYDIILQRHLGYPALEFVWIDDREMDPSAADAIDVADVKAGIRTINEVRMARGLDPMPGCDALMVATGAGYTPVVAGTNAEHAPQDDLARGIRARGLAKFNPNHWPAHAPDSQGGQFAPKGEGGDSAAGDSSGTATASDSETGARTSANSQSGASEGQSDRVTDHATQSELAATDTSSPSITIGQGPLHQVETPLQTAEMDPIERQTALEQEVRSHSNSNPPEADKEVDAFDAAKNPIVLKDETGASIPGVTYTVDDGTRDGRLVTIVNAYAAGPGKGMGDIGAMKFFSTRQALNDFLSKNGDWGEKYGNSNPAPSADTTYLFAGAANPGWSNNPSYTPAFKIDGQLRNVRMTPQQFTDAVYWHEWSHFPPTSFPGTEEGEDWPGNMAFAALVSNFSDSACFRHIRTSPRFTLCGRFGTLCAHFGAGGLR